MSITKIYSSILLLICFSFSASSQCPPPENPVLSIDGFAMIYLVGWNAPNNPVCAILYYEVEYSASPFTPGMSEGTLLSPVFGTAVDVPSWTSFAWVRSVCDCEGGPGPGEGDGIPDGNSEWVEATLYTPIYPDPSFECGFVEVTVASPLQCGSFPQEINFIAIFSDFPEVTPNCLTEAQYMLWTSFEAPSTGSVSITMSTYDFGGGEYWNDFGLIVLESCNGDQIFCEASYSEDEEVIVSGLTPGEDYVIGNWNNGYGYDWFQDEFGTYYNGTTNLISICETSDEGDDWSLTPGPLVFVECSELEPQPEYTLGDSWGNDAVVTYELMVNTTCGDTSYFLITVSDDMGHFASGEQQIIISDTTSPEILLEEEITIVCGQDPLPQYEVVDNCAAVEVFVEESIVLDCIDSYDVLYSILAIDVCGNESFASQVISVIDSIAPVFGFCPDSIFFETDVATIDMLDLSDNSNFDMSDNCSEEIVFEQSIPPGTELEVGSYPIEFTISDNCSNVSTCESIVIVTSTVSIEELSIETLNLFPNPAGEQFMLELDNKLLEAERLQVFDLTGRMILGQDLKGLLGSIITIPILDLSSGTYSVEIVDVTGRSLQRTILIKE